MVSVNSNNNKRSLADANVVTKFLEIIISPVSVKKDTMLLPEIENAIKQKVEELKSMLQDFDQLDKSRRDNHFKIEGSEETMFIEFVPADAVDTNSAIRKETKQKTDTFQQKIENYKHLSQNITKFLDTVKIARSTKKLITKSLDEMLALLMKGQCQLNSVDITHLLKHFSNNTRKSMPDLSMINMTMLRQLAPLYGLEFHDKTGNISEIMQMILPQLLAPISKLISKYKLGCYLENNENPETTGEPTSSTPNPLLLNVVQNTAFHQGKGTKDSCESFIICTNELTNFLRATYNTLKVTATNTFKDYADMYHRDIKKEIARTTDSITSKLNALSNFAEKKINEIFLKELKTFKLDKNKNTTANIQYIQNFTKAITSQSKCGINSQVDREFSDLNNKTLIIMKEDLTINIKEYMNNLRELFDNMTCSSFEKCNEVSRETRKISKRRAFKPRDAENVYVKEQRSFDNELKDFLRLVNKQNLDFRRRDVNSRLDKTVIDATDQGRYNNVNVTRPPIRTTATAGDIISSENGVTEQFF